MVLYGFDGPPSVSRTLKMADELRAKFWQDPRVEISGQVPSAKN